MRYSKKIIENTIRHWERRLLEAETEDDRIDFVLGLMQDEPGTPIVVVRMEDFDSNAATHVKLLGEDMFREIDRNGVVS